MDLIAAERTRVCPIAQKDERSKGYGLRASGRRARRLMLEDETRYTHNARAYSMGSFSKVHIRSSMLAGARALWLSGL